MLRQRREERVSRILNEHAAPSTADRARPRDPVVPGSGEDDRNRPMAVGDGRAAEEHVDRRPDAVLVSTARDDRVAGAHGQMEAGGRDVDAPRQELLATASLDRGQWTGAGEDLSEPAFAGRGQVENDANCGVEILRQPVGEGRQRLDASRGCAHDDEGGSPLVHDAPCFRWRRRETD